MADDASDQEPGAVVGGRYVDDAGATGQQQERVEHAYGADQLRADGELYRCPPFGVG